MEVKFSLSNRKAFIGVDLQEDFVQQWESRLGSKAVQNYLSHIHELMNEADLVILTKSMHPDDHFSFVEFGRHCVKGTAGAKINKYILETPKEPVIATKRSMEKGPPDSYSALEAETLRPKEDVEKILFDEDIGSVDIAGLGHSWDVAQTAFDTNALKYETRVWTNYWLTSHEMQEKLENAGITVYNYES